MRFRSYTFAELKRQQLSFETGDIILGNRESIHDKLIHIITRSKWNHAGLIINNKGDVIELREGKGISLGSVYKEREDLIKIVKLEFTQEQRENISIYATKMYKRQIKFGYLTLIATFFHIVFHSPVIIKNENHMFCSEFVANALVYGGIIWKKDPSHITPADLYDAFITKKLTLTD